MKFRLFIILPLLLLIVAGISITMVRRSSDRTTASAWNRPVRVTDKSGPPAVASSPSQISTNPSASGTLKTGWAGVESADLALWVANLRAVGCPEQTIRDLVSSRLIRRHQKKLEELAARQAQEWDFTRDRPLADSIRAGNEFENLRQELNREMESLLGISSTAGAESLRGWPSSPTGHEWMNASSRVSVAEIERKYRNRRNEIERGQVPVDSPEQKQEFLAKLRQSEQSELAAVLSPAELEELNFRNSPAVHYVLSNLPQAGSEEEFRRMVKAVERTGVRAQEDGNPLQRYALINYRQGEPSSASDEGERRSQLEAALKEELGEARFRELQQEERTRSAEEQRNLSEIQAEQWRAANLLVAESLGLDPVKAGQLLDRLQSLEPSGRSGPQSDLLPGTGGTGAMEKILELSSGPEAAKLAAEVLGPAGPEWLKNLKRF